MGQPKAVLVTDGYDKQPICSTPPHSSYKQSFHGISQFAVILEGAPLRPCRVASDTAAAEDSGSCSMAVLVTLDVGVMGTISDLVTNCVVSLSETVPRLGLGGRSDNREKVCACEVLSDW
jgi:hypothetical protein